VAEGLRFSQKLQLPVEAELAPGVGAFQCGDKLAAEDTAEHLDRKQEGIARVDPSRVVRRQPAGGNDAMEMRMKFQLLIPASDSSYAAR
jgi:hypothetical protein